MLINLPFHFNLMQKLLQIIRTILAVNVNCKHVKRTTFLNDENVRYEVTYLCIMAS